MTESKGPDTPGGSAAPKKKRKTLLDRMRPYAIGVMAMVVVFGVSAVIGAHVRGKKDTKVSEPTGAVAAAQRPTAAPTDGASPSPTAAGPKLAIPVKPSAPVTVTVYEDLRSPDSKAFQEEYGAVFKQLLATGQVQFQYRLVTASDKSYGGTGALVAANAAACAQDQSRFTDFVDQVWKNQPTDPKDDGLASEKLMKKLAAKAGKIKTASFDPCIEQLDHEGWVDKSQQDFAAAGYGDVPVVEINGTVVKDVHTSLTPAKLRSQILKEAKRVVTLRTAPTNTPALAG
ncbi:DsbA family protein [Actinacidiphila bryophytorum]|uniref:Protein-disulfide isomerase n=1 Tax=Actinacidiphila bryophytorum TaxID=1436133 RepID=A0A9W4H6E8_9ACTN|nr:thioredoxin domain-containing protein [Actinacidiphila bryophytorum]CAG7654107.1 Protein-disulfide isomerase [Actinacidiphila bryophytorum]